MWGGGGGAKEVLPIAELAAATHELINQLVGSVICRTVRHFFTTRVYDMRENI